MMQQPGPAAYLGKEQYDACSTSSGADSHHAAKWVSRQWQDHGRDILRVKGILNVEKQDVPIVIHGVQHIFHPPVPLPAWPSEDRRSRLVFITYDVGREIVEDTFQALCQVPPTSKTET